MSYICAMGMQDIAAWAQVAAVLAAAVAIYASLRGIRNDLWLQMFTEYTSRYSAITSELAQGLRTKQGPCLQELADSEREKALGTMRRYFNLCSEEMYLFVNKKIDKKTWSIWSKGIEGAMARPFFDEAWTALRDDYQFFPDFIEYMDGISKTKPSVLASFSS